MRWSLENDREMPAANAQGRAAEECRAKETHKVTFGGAKNAHNDINQWWAMRDSGSTAPAGYTALWQTPASSRMKEV